MRYKRVIIPGATYFFTINLLNRKSTLLVDHIEKLRLSFHRVHKVHFFEIEGIVILPDHIHMMMTLPIDDSNFSMRIRLIKGFFSQQIKSDEYITPIRKKKRERGIWQRRFWEHFIRDEEDYENHLNYIHYNPVKHGYVKQASDWPYSSIHRSIRTGILPKHWGYEHGFDDGVFGE